MNILSKVPVYRELISLRKKYSILEEKYHIEKIVAKSTQKDLIKANKIINTLVTSNIIIIVCFIFYIIADIL